jgi:hypothetical protein
MKNQAADTTALPRWMRGWEHFWFTPADPTVLATIRICCGAIAVYTFAVYGLMLQDTVGEHAWVELKLRQEQARDQPVRVGSLEGTVPVPRATTLEQKHDVAAYLKTYGKDLRMFGLKPPANQEQRGYLIAYTELWKFPPPAYAESAQEAEVVNRYREEFHYDPRSAGLKAPQTPQEEKYLWKYTKDWGRPPPAYAKSDEEAKAIDDYIKREEVDPRLLYARGMPIWSIWMHVTDPIGMGIVETCCVLVAILCTIGLGTRVTTALTWLASLQYIHRTPQILFGADTMMCVLLLYLTIGPSGAAMSVDRLLARWWRGERGPLKPPMPSVSANVAIRLLQIHICIIYFIAGVSKLQGNAWWNGTALWAVLANFEFAPMQFSIYNDVLRFICRNEVLMQFVMTGGCYFTLAFEIGYMFLVWFRKTRWVVLSGAILLHGTIGIFMGLKTFSLLMLIMNLAFVRPEEVRWVFGRFSKLVRGSQASPPALQPAAAASTTR